MDDEKRMKLIYLGLGLDADIERVDASGENTRNPLADERVEEIETGLCKFLETAPSLHNPYACLIYASKETAKRIHHRFSLSRSLLLLLLFLLRLLLLLSLSLVAIYCIGLLICSIVGPTYIEIRIIRNKKSLD